MTIWESLESKNSLVCPLQVFSLYFNDEPTKNVNSEKTLYDKWLYLGTDFLRRAGEDRRRGGEC